ncbi:MAG: hypothetical protein JO334_05055 [Verrucomicrobia bacterium]|nr:hypothetical protein [Verrucomicrobiota bacterium]
MAKRYNSALPCCLGGCPLLVMPTRVGRRRPLHSPISPVGDKAPIGNADVLRSGPLTAGSSLEHFRTPAAK